MIPLQPESPSLILRAAHILAVRVESAAPREWSPPADNLVGREVALHLRLEEVLKGKTVEPPGTSFAVTIHQQGTATGRVAGMPGAWSHVTIAAGARLVVFAREGSDKATEQANDPLCQVVLPSDEALVDVELAAEGASKGWSLDELVHHAIAKASKLDLHFAEYLVARWGDAALADPHVEEHLLRLLVTPQLGVRARATLLHELSALATSHAGNTRFVVRLAAAVFDLLGLKEAGVVRDQAVTIYLPNLLGLQGAMPRRKADEVFHDAPARRAAAQAHLGAFSGPAAALLAEWLKT